MLQSRNLSNVLSQVVHPQKAERQTSIYSSILITVSGQPIASYHAKRPVEEANGQAQPPHYEDASTINSSASGHSKESAAQDKSYRYNVNRTIKTKLYSLFASQAWSKYQQAGMGRISTNGDGKGSEYSPNSDDRNYANQHDWICFRTDDATNLLITPVNLQSTSSQLLLVVVSHESCPLGIVLKKSQETVKVLEDGLDNYRVFE